MSLLNAVRRGFRYIWNIGVTPDIRPEEAKHIRYTNIFAFLLCATSIAAFIQGIAVEKIPIIIPIANISASALSLVVYALNRSGRHNAATIYLFLVSYALALFICPLSGKEAVDHYFLFIPIAYSSLLRSSNSMFNLSITVGLKRMPPWVTSKPRTFFADSSTGRKSSLRRDTVPSLLRGMVQCHPPR